VNSFDLAAIFLGLVAAAGWVNSRWLRLPPSVAMLAVGVVGSLLIAVLRHTPGVGPAADALMAPIARVNFPETVVGYMLAFLLFAGSMQVDLEELRRRHAEVWSLATFGVLASTVIVGLGVWAAANALRLPLPLPWAFVFGALISPTDPVAVLATVKTGQLSKSLQAILQGEALFNDGVGIVVFLAALAFAAGGHAVAPGQAGLQVLGEAAGGLLLGAGAGFLVVRAMRAIDDYAVEVALSLALALGVYAGGQALHLSGAIAAVAAGLMVGDSGVRTAMSELTRRYVLGFWTLVDEILNALLFLLLGLQTAVLPLDVRHLGLAAAAVPLVLLARLAVVLPWGAWYRFRMQERGASLILAWGGLRGALSLALALQTPQGPARDVLLATTYAVVVFAVVVQGLSFEPLVAALARLPRGEVRARTSGRRGGATA
jgi:monovalent cation:H+ antiporter, CPA1 family